jgi:hypothetical protein
MKPDLLKSLCQERQLGVFERHRVRDDAQAVAHPLPGERSDLLGGCLRVAIEARARGSKQDEPVVVRLSPARRRRLPEPHVESVW